MEEEPPPFSRSRLPDPERVLWVCDHSPSRFLPCDLLRFTDKTVTVLILASHKAGRIMTKEWADLRQGDLPSHPRIQSRFFVN